MTTECEKLSDVDRKAMAGQFVEALEAMFPLYEVDFAALDDDEDEMEKMNWDGAQATRFRLPQGDRRALGRTTPSNL